MPLTGWQLWLNWALWLLVLIPWQLWMTVRILRMKDRDDDD